MEKIIGKNSIIYETQEVVKVLDETLIINPFLNFCSYVRIPSEKNKG